MTLQKVRAAEEEANRFLQRVRDLKMSTSEVNVQYSLPASVNSAAVKRASMDLTRTLADLRRAD